MKVDDINSEYGPAVSESERSLFGENYAGNGGWKTGAVSIGATQVAALAATGKSPNPKQQFGDKKPRLTLTPLTAQIAQQEAQLDGMLKYGEVNWRKNPVEAKTYIDAAMRHLRLYECGEELARDTTVQNLGAVMACCAILIDSAAHGTMIDNRDHSPQSANALHEAEAMVTTLRGKQVQRELDAIERDIAAAHDRAKKSAPKTNTRWRSVIGARDMPTMLQGYASDFRIGVRYSNGNEVALHPHKVDWRMAEAWQFLA